jgi:hypothetical protein
VERKSMGDRAQPAAHRSIPRHACGLPRQNQKRRLINILHIVVIAKHATADPFYERSMTLNEGHERRLFATIHEPLQQHRVAQRLGHCPKWPPRNSSALVGFIYL